MPLFKRKAMPVIAAAAGAVLLLGGCSSGKSGSGGYGGSTGKSSPSPSNLASPTGAAGPATTVTATETETEFKAALSQATFKPGTYTFTVVNKGKFPHNLTVAGPGSPRRRHRPCKAAVRAL